VGHGLDARVRRRYGGVSPSRYLAPVYFRFLTQGAGDRVLTIEAQGFAV